MSVEDECAAEMKKMNDTIGATPGIDGARGPWIVVSVGITFLCHKVEALQKENAELRRRVEALESDGK